MENENTAKLILIPTDQLHLNTKNPRTISETRLKALMESIKTDPDFLYSRPILATKVNNRFVVYGGEQRLKALKLLDVSQVPVMVEEDIDPEILDRRVLLDNTHRGEFDPEMMKDFTAELQKALNQTPEFVSALFNGTEETVKRQGKSDTKVYSYNIEFQTVEGANAWDVLAEQLLKKYQDVSLSQRLLLYLSQQM